MRFGRRATRSLRTSHLDNDQIMANADAVKADLEEAKAKAGEGM